MCFVPNDALNSLEKELAPFEIRLKVKVYMRYSMDTRIAVGASCSDKSKGQMAIYKDAATILLQNMRGHKAVLTGIKHDSQSMLVLHWHLRFLKTPKKLINEAEGGLVKGKRKLELSK